MTTQPAFADLAAEFLHEEFEHYPTRASGLGLHEYDGRLDDLSAAAWQARDDAAADWHDRFSAVPDDGLSFDERIDRDLVISAMRGRTILADWQNWRRDPTLYGQLALDGIFKLLLHRLRPEAELAEAIVSRLEAIPAALDEGWANLDADHLTLAAGLDPGRDQDRHRDHAAVLAHLLEGGIQHQVGVLGVEAASAEGRHLTVQLLADTADLILGDALQAERLGEAVDRPGRDAVHVGLLNHRQQRPLVPAPGLQ